MEMRAERGWASFKMTLQRWVTETTEFNLRLEKKNEAENRQTIKKKSTCIAGQTPRDGGQGVGAHCHEQLQM